MQYLYKVKINSLVVACLTLEALQQAVKAFGTSKSTDSETAFRVEPPCDLEHKDHQDETVAASPVKLIPKNKSLLSSKIKEGKSKPIYLSPQIRSQLYRLHIKMRSPKISALVQHLRQYPDKFFTFNELNQLTEFSSSGVTKVLGVVKRICNKENLSISHVFNVVENGTVAGGTKIKLSNNYRNYLGFGQKK